MPKEEESLLGLGLSPSAERPRRYPLEVRFGSFKITPDQKATIPRRQSSKGLFCRMCRLEVVTIEIHEQYCDLSVENHNTARGSQLWAEAEHDGGLVVTGAE
jgi:hypothetical protein